MRIDHISILHESFAPYIQLYYIVFLVAYKTPLASDKLGKSNAAPNSKNYDAHQANGDTTSP